MKYFLLTCCILVFAIQSAQSNKIVLDPNNKSHSLEWALPFVTPGDTIYLMPGNHQSNQYISNLHGTAEKPIYIMGDEDNRPIIKAGNQAIHFSNVSYLHISNIIFTEQTLNGVNIDDGGDYDTPTHHIIIEYCHWSNMAAKGNNDFLKMSGVDDFEIRYCVFRHGSEGGSLIDMVGCHNGIIERVNFVSGGSNSIQAKGGTSNIIIRRNHFNYGGLRSINCGGSTGLPYFRPIDAQYEAADIDIYSNMFFYSETPIAFVGAINCRFINNTIIYPQRWIARVLQESTDERFVKCSNNTFANNICAFNNDADHEQGINIGANTLPETFTFTNNLWYNQENENWNGPNKAFNHQNTIVNQDPMLKNDVGQTLGPDSNSPAIAKGAYYEDIILDFDGFEFKDPRSIGAVEYQGEPSSIIYINDEIKQTRVYPNPANEEITLVTYAWKTGIAHISIFDISGREVIKFKTQTIEGEFRLPLDVSGLNSGTYYLTITLEGKEKKTQFVIAR